MNESDFAQRSLLLVTSWVTGAIATLIAGITASPSLAATLASSEARVETNNFSYTPQEVRVLAGTQATALASDDPVFAQASVNSVAIASASKGSVIAQADANAVAPFDPNNPPQGFSNFSLSTASGEGSGYLGMAQSQAEVIAYDFLVGDSKPFSFDFNAALDLSTSIDNPQAESASATGQLSFNLYDSTDKNNLKWLNSLTISGNLTTPGDGDYLDSQLGNNITLTSDSKDTSFGGTQETAFTALQGQFSRSFTHPTDLTLIEVKINQATVSTVPEPSNTLGLFFGALWVGLRVRSKAQKPKLISTHVDSSR